MNSHKEIVLDGELSLNIPMDGEVGAVTKVVEHDLPVYTGETVITPSTTEQVLATAEKRNQQIPRQKDRIYLHPQGESRLRLTHYWQLLQYRKSVLRKMGHPLL